MEVKYRFLHKYIYHYRKLIKVEHAMLMFAYTCVKGRKNTKNQDT